MGAGLCPASWRRATTSTARVGCDTRVLGQHARLEGPRAQCCQAQYLIIFHHVSSQGHGTPQLLRGRGARSQLGRASVPHGGCHRRRSKRLSACVHSSGDSRGRLAQQSTQRERPALKGVQACLLRHPDNLLAAATPCAAQAEGRCGAMVRASVRVCVRFRTCFLASEPTVALPAASRALFSTPLGRCAARVWRF